MLFRSVDVDAGFLVEALVVVLPDVLAPPVGERAAASWESTKGLHVRLGMDQAPFPPRSLITRTREDGKNSTLHCNYLENKEKS